MVKIETLKDFMNIGTLTQSYKGFILYNANQNGSDYIIVVCDTFDYSDYCVEATEKTLKEKYAKYDYQNMQKIMGVYKIRP